MKSKKKVHLKAERAKDFLAKYFTFMSKVKKQEENRKDQWCLVGKFGRMKMNI